MFGRIGLFGGTFNPIHIGHVVLAESVYKDFKLDEMVFIPSKLPPHKDVKGATEQDRYKMAELTAKALGKGFIVSDYEINSQGISYSYKTIKYWREMYPESLLFFVAGSDIFVTICSWGSWELIFGLANFIVVNRDGVTFDEMLDKIPKPLLPKVIQNYDPAKFGAKSSNMKSGNMKYGNMKYGNILLYDMDPVPVSSTSIRMRIAEGRCSELLPEDVYRYIVTNNLYENFSG